jgi:hypothetical protein
VVVEQADVRAAGAGIWNEYKAGRVAKASQILSIFTHLPRA